MFLSRSFNFYKNHIIQTARKETKLSNRKLFVSTQNFLNKKNTKLHDSRVLFQRSFCTAPSSTDQSEEKHVFKAETNKLLDIVTNSIYTDKEIFLRELISNAADAIEKFRHLSAKGEQVLNGDRELDIKITLNAQDGKFIIEDAGIGMTKSEMMENLGTIAKSGSKAFVQDAENSKEDVAKNVIGQFGVGFYSAFMVGNEIQVFSKAARQEESNSTAYCWTSSGIDNFSIREAPEFQDGIGTKIVITLKDDQKKEFLDKDNVTRVIKKYSNYVGFPVMVNGDRANEVEAIWTRKAQDISDEEYDNFYKFVSGSFAPSMLRLHFQTDVPIDMKALIFCPEMHLEKMGMGRMAPGINLYSRKVLLDANSEKLLPQWMRFMKGVVDSEDLPISLSRETMQDSRLMASISKALTSRTIKLFADHAKKQPKEYNEKFYPEFGGFIKEGIVSDYNNQAAIAKLLRFNSSTINRNELTSLDDYISRCPPEQDKIYYLIAQTRKNAEESPYYELFKNQNVEVLFLYNNIDDFVMTNLQTYNGRKLINATSEEASDIDKNKKKDDEKKDDDKGDDDKKDDTNSKELVEWLSTALEGKAKKVSATTRLFGSPALVVPSESAAMRRMVKNLNAQMAEDDDDLEPQHLQINPKHKIFEQIYEMRNKDPALANEYAEGVYQSAVMAAGLSDDPAELVPKIQKLMEKLTAYQN